MIREAGEADFAAATELMNALSPFRVGSSAGLLHTARTEPAAAARRFWAAEDDGALVGWGTAVIDYETADAAGFANIAVASSHSKRGIGSSLLAACLAHLEDLRVDVVRGRSEPDAHTRAFAAGQGFEQTSVTRVSGVDPAAVTAAEPPPDVELVALETLPVEVVFALDDEVSQDVPNEQLDAVELQQWVEDHWRHPDRDLTGSTAALVDGQLASYSFLRVAPDGRAITDMTGTRREHRGRGLAEIVKRATLVNAARRGASIAITYNDATNAAMLRVNERLGYRPLGETLGWARRR
ncbi:MAG: GNAT family N-acetyltransferase [Actinobacteria bacterium]|nr:GNAT family N-acetyltransferase [Actinomycetota bacterium]